MQISLCVCEFKIFGLLFSLEHILHCHGTCTILNNLYYLMVSCVKHYRKHLFRILCAKVSEAPLPPPATTNTAILSIMTSKFVIAMSSGYRSILHNVIDEEQCSVIFQKLWPDDSHYKHDVCIVHTVVCQGSCQVEAMSNVKKSSFK